MDPQQEMLDILHRVLAKLKALPQADPLEIGAFTVFLLFVAMFFGMIVIACCGCWSRKTKNKSERVHPS